MLDSGKIIIISIFFLALFLPISVGADKIDELRAKINDREAQLAEIQKEIEQYEKELEEVGAEKDTLNNAIKALDITRSKIQADIRGIQTQINNETLNIEKLNLEIVEKEKRIRENNRAIAESLRRIRENDNFSMIESVLAERSLSDFWESLDALESFQSGIKNDLEKLRDTKEKLFEDVEEVEERRITLVSIRGELDDKKGIVDQNKAEKNELLKITENKEENFQTLLEQKIEQREEFERELFEFESALQFQLDPSKIPPSGQGILKWPIDNVRITQRFGKTSSSGRLYASGTHNGVDFGISTGSNIYSALGGVVEGTGNTDQFRGCLSYGKWVLVKHNNGLSTLYAHLSGITVSPGEEVRTGDIVGYSGNTGYSTGPHLHFSVFASQGVRLQRLGDIKSITNCANAVIPIAPRDAYLDPLVYL